MKTVRENLVTLLDCFTGADGGVSFVRLRTFLENIEHMHSEDSYQMLLAVERLALLIKILAEEK